MSIDEFVAASDTNLSKVKLDTPAVWIKVGLKDGTFHELKASKALGGYAYTQHPARQDLIKLSPWRLRSLQEEAVRIAGCAGSSHGRFRPRGIDIEPASGRGACGKVQSALTGPYGSCKSP